MRRATHPRTFGTHVARGILSSRPKRRITPFQEYIMPTRKSPADRSKARARSTAAKTSKAKSGGAKSQAKPKRATARTAVRKGPKAIAMLIKDHRAVQKMFKQVVKMKDASEARDLIEQTCSELTVHAQLEEDVFYPFARERLDEPDLVNEAQVEHQVARDLIAQLQGGEGDDEQQMARYTVLAEYTNHHIQEEEKELFPKLMKMKGVREELEQLGEEMQQRKMELSGGEKSSGEDAEEARAIEDEEFQDEMRARSGEEIDMGEEYADRDERSVTDEERGLGVGARRSDDRSRPSQAAARRGEESKRSR
jgi:hemerythrin superfamily protein